MLVTSREFRSKYYNGDDFATVSTPNENLAGSVMEVKEATFVIELRIRSDAQINLPFTINAVKTSITRSSGSFIADGFRIGDRVNIAWNGNSSVLDIIQVTTTEIIYSYSSGDAMADDSSNDTTITLSSDLTACSFNYNIVENTVSKDYNNFIDDSTQGWYAEGMTDGGGAVTCSPIGESLNKSWINGSATCSWVKGSNGTNTFTIVHTFVIPYFEDGQLNNIQDIDTPEDYEGNLSYKYIGDFQFLRTLTFPNSGRGGQDNAIIGAVGWFNEPFNGLNMPFSITDLVYEDGSANVIEKIVADTDTVIKFTINSTSSSFGSSGSTNTGALVSKLPKLIQYQEKGNTFSENWLYDSVYEVTDTPATIGSPYIIKAYEATYVDVNTIDVEMTVNFPDVENTDNYLIACEVASDGGSNVLSDKTVLIVGTNTFEKSADVTGLMALNEMFFELYPDAVGDNDFTNIEGWVEDSLNCNFQFELDTSKGAYLETLDAKIVAYNTSDGTWFELEKISFPLQDEVISLGAQQFNVDQERGFNMPKGDYNIIKLENLVSTPPIQEYEGQVSIKIDWQEWLRLDNADTVFYDNSKENNGLNENASNYSLVNGYEIRILLDANVSNGVASTNYVFSSPQNEIYNYDLDDNGTPLWDGVIETFDDSGTALGEGILSKGDTTIKATFTPTGGSYINETVIISLEPINAPSKNQIVINDATVSYSGSDVIGTYILSPNEVQKGIKYKISARLRTEDDVCSENVVALAITYPTPKSGLFTFDLDIFEIDGTTPLATGIVQFTFNDGSTDLYQATFNIGDNISSAVPLTDTGDDPFTDIQAYFTSAIIQNGSSFNFDKLSWAVATGYVNDGTNTDEKEFDVSFQTITPCSSNVATDTIVNKTWFEFRSNVIAVFTSGQTIANGVASFGNLSTVSAINDFYNSNSNIYLNPTGAIRDGVFLVGGLHPAASTQIGTGGVGTETNFVQIQTTAEGNCANARVVKNNAILFQLYTSAGTWDEGQNITFTRATGNTLGVVSINSEVKLIKGGSLLAPTHNIPIQTRVTGGTTESTNSYGSAQTSLVVNIPALSGYGVFHVQDVLSGNIGGVAREIQDIILIKLIKY